MHKLLAGLALAAGLTFTLVAPLAAQSIPVTTCPGCGPGPNNGDGTKGYAWVDHRCEPSSNRSIFTLTVGLGARVDVPFVYAYASAPGDNITQPIGIVRPGRQLTKVIYEGTSDVSITVALFAPDGNDFPFYGSNGLKVFVLKCDCSGTGPGPSPVTTSPATTPPTGPTSQPPTSPTTAPGTTLHSTVPGAPTLPATGPSEVVTEAWPILAVILLFAGGVLVLAARRWNDPDETR